VKYKNALLFLVIFLYWFVPVWANPIAANSQEVEVRSRSIEVVPPSLGISIPHQAQNTREGDPVTVELQLNNKAFERMLSSHESFIISKTNPSYIIKENSESLLILDNTQIVLASFSIHSPQELINSLEQYVWAKNLAFHYSNRESGIIANFENPRIGRLFRSKHLENYVVRNDNPAYILILTISPRGIVNILYPTSLSETLKFQAKGSLEFPISVDPMSIPGGEQILSIAVSNPTNSWMTYFSQEWPLKYKPQSTQLKVLKNIIDQQSNFSVFLHEFVSISP